MNTSNFLAAITPEAKHMILTTIANHYGISVDEAYEEVIDPEAENLLDYLTGSSRLATLVLMQKHGFKG